jgi:hypothetical protein
MRRINRVPLFIILGSVFFGIAVDFLFNGIVVGYIFNRDFSEKWSFIYIPLFFAVAMTLSNYLLQSTQKRLANHAVGAFFLGNLLGHLTFVGVPHSPIYWMTFDEEYDAGENGVLLRSTEWQQILFVTSGKARAEIQHHFKRAPIPVTLSITTDYGCNRSAFVSTVAGIDVMIDGGATWTWQVDHNEITQGKRGPAMEDQSLFWCHRPPKLKYLVETPWLRPWEIHPVKPQLQK